ncbi:MAG: hypothetical protein LBV12_05445 [Puniceicoccales bacterium]|nr:hypothetical protein [Puniceicoccales bacterium]
MTFAFSFSCLAYNADFDGDQMAMRITRGSNLLSDIEHVAVVGLVFLV